MEGRAGANAGASILELQTGANLQQLQASLATDPHVELVARVPVRYLMARQKTTRRTGPATRAAEAAPGGAAAAAAPPAPDIELHRTAAL